LPLSERERKAIAAGAIIAGASAAGILVYKALAERPTTPPPPTIPPTPIIPPTPPGPNLPVGVEAILYPTSIVQFYGFYYTAPNIVDRVLQVNALTGFNGPPWPTGLVRQRAVFKVVDAAGAGVPNIDVDCYANNLTDDQGGMLTIDGNRATTVQTKKSNANGEVVFLIGYQTNNVSKLCALHTFHCCIFILITPVCFENICVGERCEIPKYIGYAAQGPVSTQIRVYNITARMSGTVRSTGFAVGCNMQSKALW